MSPEPSAADIVEALVGRALRDVASRPVVVGICGAQGSGKSTVAAAVADRLGHAELRVAVLSLDDLYLTRIEREQLARDGHPLFRTRGVPGTHDVALGFALLDELSRPGPTSLPRFDKAADDRSPQGEWTLVKDRPDVLLFEGWCVGARPQPVAALTKPVNRLEAEEDRDGCWRRAVNDALAGDYQRLFARIDRLVLLAAPSFEVVRHWRGEQEAALRAQRGSGAPGVMDDAALDRFVAHYERIARHVLASMPAYADAVIRLDARRRVLAASVTPSMSRQP